MSSWFDSICPLPFLTPDDTRRKMESLKAAVILKTHFEAGTPYFKVPKVKF
jgi:hypothetical protein